MSEDFSRDFRYHGLSAAQLAEIIYAQKLQGYDGIIEENAKLRQENARLQQRPDTRLEAQSIGLIIQGILDRGFFVNYTFDRRGDNGTRWHHFGIWKYHGEEMIMARILVDDFELKQSIMPCIPRIEQRMNEIDTQLIQRRLIEEALS